MEIMVFSGTAPAFAAGITLTMIGGDRTPVKMLFNVGPLLPLCIACVAVIAVGRGHRAVTLLNTERQLIQGFVFVAEKDANCPPCMCCPLSFASGGWSNKKEYGKREFGWFLFC